MNVYYHGDTEDTETEVSFSPVGRRRPERKIILQEAGKFNSQIIDFGGSQGITYTIYIEKEESFWFVGSSRQTKNLFSVPSVPPW